MKPRVVILDHTAELGGAELALLRLCRAVDRDEVDMHLVLFANGPLRLRLEAIGLKVTVIPLADDLANLDRHGAARWSVANVRRAGRLLPFVWRLARCIRRLRSDVIVSNSLKTFLIGCVVAPLVRRPLVWHVHDRIAADYLPTSVVTLVRAMARIAPRAVVTNSIATARTLPGVHCIVAYPGFAPEQPIGSMAERVEPAASVVGLIGRISPTKGQLEFVRAARKLVSAHPDIRFRIVGSPIFGAQGYADRLRSEIDGLGLGNAVDVVGFADNIESEIDRLAVLVHASPVPEPFGQVVVEAIIRGVPVIATRGGGVTEILDPIAEGVTRMLGAVGGGSVAGPAASQVLPRDDPQSVGQPEAPQITDLGVLVAPGDVVQLASAIVDVLAEPAAARDRARRAYESAMDRFSISRTAATVTDVWAAASKSRRSRPSAGRSRGLRCGTGSPGASDRADM